MMKRWLAVFCVMALLAAALPALAQGESAPAVMALYDRTAEGDVYLGTAVHCDGQYVTVTGIAAAGVAQPYLTDGEQVMEIASLRGTEGGLAFAIPVKEEPGDALPLAEAAAGESVVLLSVSAQGTTASLGSPLSPVQWQEQACYLTQTDAAVPLGAAVLNGEGSLVGLIAASWGEGINVYVVLPLTGALAGGASAGEDQLTRSLAPEWLTDFTATASGQWIEVDWSSCRLPEQATGFITVYVMDVENPYYSWITADAGQGSLAVAAAPGRTYALWVRSTDSVPEDVPALGEDYQTVSMPQSRPFNLYGYRDTALYVGLLPAGLDEGAAALLQAEEATLTLDALAQAGQEVYLQAVSKYRVKKDVTCDMLLVLTTPENYDYLLQGSFIFMADLADSDVWNCSLQSLLDDYQAHAGGFAPGEYTIRYYFDGTLVNTLTLQLR